MRDSSPSKRGVKRAETITACLQEGKIGYSIFNLQNPDEQEAHDAFVGHLGLPQPDIQSLTSDMMIEDVSPGKLALGRTALTRQVIRSEDSTSVIYYAHPE